MVGQQPLKLFILVRIQVPEPGKATRHCVVFLLPKYGGLEGLPSVVFHHHPPRFPPRFRGTTPPRFSA